MRRVVVTGMGLLSTLGNNKDITWMMITILIVILSWIKEISKGMIDLYNMA